MGTSYAKRTTGPPKGARMFAARFVRRRRARPPGPLQGFRLERGQSQPRQTTRVEYVEYSPSSPSSFLTVDDDDGAETSGLRLRTGPLPRSGQGSNARRWRTRRPGRS